MWFKVGSNYTPQDSGVIEHSLPPGVYTVKASLRGLYLSYEGEELSIPEKLYKLEDLELFKERVLTYFLNTDKSVTGVLLHGTKGSSKTVVAKQLCNTLIKENYVVVLIKEAFKGLEELINEITQPSVLFFDEFEKVFDKNDTTILNILDGVNTNANKNKTLALLTANKLYVSEYLLNRPTRIRYKKVFEGLPISSINYLIDKCLNVDKLLAENKDVEQYKSDLSTTLCALEIPSIDGVLSLIEEVNLTGKLSTELIKDFNLEIAYSSYNIYVYTLEGDKVKDKYLFKQEATTLNPTIFESRSKGNYFVIDNFYMGILYQIISSNRAVLKVNINNQTHSSEEIHLANILGLKTSYVKCNSLDLTYDINQDKEMYKEWGGDGSLKDNLKRNPNLTTEEALDDIDYEVNCIVEIQPVRSTFNTVRFF